MVFAAVLRSIAGCFKFCLLVGLLFLTSSSKGQEGHTQMNSRGYKKNSIWGNSTFLAAGFTRAAQDELTFDVGRANIDASEIAWYSRVYGVGYSHVLTGRDN